MGAPDISAATRRFREEYRARLADQFRRRTGHRLPGSYYQRAAGAVLPQQNGRQRIFQHTYRTNTFRVERIKLTLHPVYHHHGRLPQTGIVPPELNIEFGIIGGSCSACIVGNITNKNVPAGEAARQWLIKAAGLYHIQAGQPAGQGIGIRRSRCGAQFIASHCGNGP